MRISTHAFENDVCIMVVILFGTQFVKACVYKCGTWPSGFWKTLNQVKFHNSMHKWTPHQEVKHTMLCLVVVSQLVLRAVLGWAIKDGSIRSHQGLPCLERASLVYKQVLGKSPKCCSPCMLIGWHWKDVYICPIIPVNVILYKESKFTYMQSVENQ